MRGLGLETLAAAAVRSPLAGVEAENDWRGAIEDREEERGPLVNTTVCRRYWKVRVSVCRGVCCVC